MDKIQLGGTDLNVSRLCFGNMTFGGQTDEATAGRILDCCLANGINFIDTANVYNKGASEEMLGRLLQGRRHRIVLATKVRGAMGEYGGLGRAAILRAVEESLRRLGTGHIDLYYLHQPDYEVPIEETLEACEQLVRDGKVRHIGTSNFASWQVIRMLWAAQRNAWKPVTAAQMMYNLVARGIEQEFLPMAQEMGIPLVVYNPLAGGMLTGKQSREAPLRGTRFDKNQMYLDRYWHPQYFDAVDRLSAVAREAGRTLVSLSLNWLLHHTQTACVILGASKLEHLEQNLKAAGEGPLDEATLAQCQQVWAGLRGITPNYNR
ncbi:MAG: aldo/keto reductase [Acidobacteriia bacterium]|nr:aldo/keto reductase [Terriglobia bacterium]